MAPESYTRQPGYSCCCGENIPQPKAISQIRNKLVRL